jgi:hypothetical protein
LGRQRLEHFGGKSAIPLRLPRRAQLAPTGSFCCLAYIGCSFCSLKIEFSFLNRNLMVQAGHRIIFGAATTPPPKLGFMTSE